MKGLYVYGVTHAETVFPGSLRGVEDMPVTTVLHDRCAALVSELSGDRPLGTRADLLGHEKVLDQLASEHVPVLPFRFGAVMPGAGEVSGELLTVHQEKFLAELGRIADRVELVVKGRYEQNSVYREVLAEEPQLDVLRRQLQGVPEDAAYQERIRLGELVAQAMDRKRAVDGERLVQTLAPYAEQIAARRLAREDEVATAAFLIHRDRREAFEKAVEGLGQAWATRVKLRLIGPLPPYDFVGQATVAQGG
jgi:hypothetical protein